MYVSEEPFTVEGNPAFVARGKVREESDEQVLFARVMRAAEMAQRQGLPLEPDVVAQQDARLTRAHVASLMATEKFRIAAFDRGIDLSEKPGLSAEQLAALAIYTDMSRPLSHPQKLRAAGVTQAKWSGWLRQRPFNDELSFLSRGNLRASVAVGEQRLAEHVDNGSMPAIEFVFAMEGRFRKDMPAIDMRGILLDIYTILDEEGVPLPTLARVSDKIKALLGEPVQMDAVVVTPQPIEQGATQ